METPVNLKQIADDVLAGKPRRAKVRTLLGYFGLKRRRESGLGAIRTILTDLGISTIPSFEVVGFDDQVRFVILGSDHAADETSEEDALVAFSLEAIGVNRFRALLKTFDSHERFLNRVVSDRLARVLQKGQNPRREDRDKFPFFVTIEGDTLTTEKVESWLTEAVELDYAEPSEGSDPVTEIVETEIAESGLRDHLTDLHEAMRAEFGRQISELRLTVERKVDEVRLDAIRQIAKEVNNEEAMRMINEFDAEMRLKLDQKDQELKVAFSEISLLHSKISDLEEQVLDLDELDPEDAYPTMKATVELFATLSQDHPVLVAEAAVRSAMRSGSTKRREVLNFLLTLREYSHLVFGTGAAAPRPTDWFKSRGYEYAQGDSESTSNRFGAERLIQVDGLKIQFEEHVTLFPNTSNCVTVYWFRDDEHRKLIVGYVGPHLRTSSW